jgi:hypothetical protein
MQTDIPAAAKAICCSDIRNMYINWVSVWLLHVDTCSITQWSCTYCTGAWRTPLAFVSVSELNCACNVNNTLRLYGKTQLAR